MDISQLLPDLGGWCFKFYGSINPDERMILPSVNYVLPNPIWRHPRWLHFDTDQVHDYDWSLIGMAKSQLLLNILRLCFKLHGSIYPMESVNYHRLIIFRKSKMATSKMADLCYLASNHHFVPAVTFDQPL